MNNLQTIKAILNYQSYDYMPLEEISIGWLFRRERRRVLSQIQFQLCRMQIRVIIQASVL